jgi:hypothetical protein
VTRHDDDDDDDDDDASVSFIATRIVLRLEVYTQNCESTLHLQYLAVSEFAILVAVMSGGNI